MNPNMARVYRLTSDTSEKEKAVGGILTFGQTGWLVLGLVIFAGIFVSLSRVMSIAMSVVIGLIPALGISLPFAFYEKGGLKLSQYLMWRIKFSKKQKHLVNTMTYRLDRPESFAREQKTREVDFS